MTLAVEGWAGWIGIGLALAVLVFLTVGIIRGLGRETGRSSGRMPGLLRSKLFYILASLLFFGICALLWKPLPLHLSVPVRVVLLIVGGLVYLIGWGLVFWGRLALGKNYFVSTSLSAQLYSGHQLVTSGPYALVRHPLYLGLILAAFGGLLFYRNWTFAVFAFCFFGLTRRARLEEKVLQEEFGESWLAYCQKTPGFIPRLDIAKLREWYVHLPKSLTALFEMGILFLPGIPAYIWIWPVLEGLPLQIFQDLTYIYVILGTLYIGLRRWSLSDLGLNLRGLALSLSCGVALVGGRSLIILSVDWRAQATSFTPVQIIGEFLFYFVLVGLGEEILCRGLLYRALEEWRGLRWAIWGSSIGFGLWHVFGQGPLVGITMVLYGLVFGLIRWRAGGIIGLILVHGAIDFAGVLMTPDLNIPSSIGKIGIASREGILAGMALIVLTPLYVWLLHPRINHLVHPRTA